MFSITCVYEPEELTPDSALQLGPCKKCNTALQPSLNDRFVGCRNVLFKTGLEVTDKVYYNKWERGQAQVEIAPLACVFFFGTAPTPPLSRIR